MPSPDAAAATAGALALMAVLQTAVFEAVGGVRFDPKASVLPREARLSDHGTHNQE